MAEVKIQQVKSSAGASTPQLETLRSLKLGRIGKSASFSDTPQLRGMIRVVDHLVEIEDGGEDS